jgi:hypothetical protein
VIELIFTLDYEIYGNGSGSLDELVYRPGEELRRIFRKWDARFVNFVEVAELERIEEQGSDPAINRVLEQIRRYYLEGFEIALHLHPQWYNAAYANGNWRLDSGEYNLCTLEPARISEIVDRSLKYLRRTVGNSEFTPLSFRAGNWLFQPTGSAAAVLTRHGIRVDSSVFKGGRQHNHRMDYRPALRNGWYWPFSTDVNVPDASGSIVEVPIYSQMVPIWKARTPKRMQFGNTFGMAAGGAGSGKWNRLRDFLRFRYPLKLDFCRMTLNELTSMMENLISEDRKQPLQFRPIVAIGHTKDLSDPGTVDAFLGFLRDRKINITTFGKIYSRVSKMPSFDPSSDAAQGHLTRA